MMECRKIGKLEVSAIGLAFMGMSHAYGPAADKLEMKELLSRAVAMGYNFFDTAEVYGTDTDQHDNERLVGEALRRTPMSEVSGGSKTVKQPTKK